MMSDKLRFRVEAIDGNFEREYDTVEEFKNKELGQYVGLNSYSMTSSDGICVYYPADDYTKKQIEEYQAASIANDLAKNYERNTQVIIANASGLGFANLYKMQKHIEKNGNDGEYYVETDSGRFFIESRDDGSFFKPLEQGRYFNIYEAQKDQIVDVFKSESLGFGVKKKEGINSFLIDPNTMLIQDTTKTHTSIESIKNVKASKENGVISVIRSSFYDGNEDTPGTTHKYTPAVISVDRDTYFSILKEHYPEYARESERDQFDYDEHYNLETNTLGYVYDKDFPIDISKVNGFNAKILKDKDTTMGEVILVTKDFLDEIHSNDAQGLTVSMYDGDVYLELGKAYEATGSTFSSKRSFTEIPTTHFKKMKPKENDLDFLF